MPLLPLVLLRGLVVVMGLFAACFLEFKQLETLGTTLSLFSNYSARIFVGEQTSTVTANASSIYVPMTMFTLDLVREFAKLEGLDAALVLDDLLGAVARRFVPVTTLRE